MYAVYAFKKSFDIKDIMSTGIHEDDYQNDFIFYDDDSELIKRYTNHEEAIDDWYHNYSDTDYELTMDTTVNVTFYVLVQLHDYDEHEIKEISDGELSADEIADYLSEIEPENDITHSDDGWYSIGFYGHDSDGNLIHWKEESEE